MKLAIKSIEILNAAPEITHSDAIKRNTAKQEARKFANHITTAKGKLQAYQDDNGEIVYQVFDLTFWNTKSQQWEPASSDPDKFQARADDFETAKTEFWARWKQYVSRRFKRSFIKLELEHI